jgi:hypothetical protein
MIRNGQSVGVRQAAALSWMAALVLSCLLATAAPQSIARVWNERALEAVRVDTPHPPAQARNLFSLAVCMYDAWAAYDTNAVGYVYRGKHTAPDVAAARREAISYAAYWILRERHVYSRSDINTLAADDLLMASLGYDTNVVTRAVAVPAGVGNSVYDAVSAWFLNDGARQTNGTQAKPYPDYPDGQGGYVYTNDPLQAGTPGIAVQDINRWQRLQLVVALDQHGFPQSSIQNYLGPQWLGVRPFALSRTDPGRPWIDPGPPPRFGGPTHAQFVAEAVAVIRASGELTPDDGVTLDISPGAMGNNSLTANDGQGHALNPVTGLPYAANVVRRGDFARVLSEFWADGPNSETPPGHWNVIANGVSDHPLTVKRIGGTGPVVDDLEWDVKIYFAVNAAVHDAACAAWSLKRYYDGWRPISAIRYLGKLGQSSDPLAPSYNTNGLPLVPGLIEVVTPATSAAGGRHAGLTPGAIALQCWPGQAPDPTTNHQGVRWVSSDAWTTYQRTNFVTPAFPGYVSGHSAFSRAAAEVLAGITGSPFFPGGLGTYDAPQNTKLVNEQGPSQTVQLQWATYFDAADLAGLSRIYGGIHPPVDNFAGRRVGAEAGKAVWSLAKTYFDGSIARVPTQLALARSPDGLELRYPTLRGLFYQLQSAPTPGQPFSDVVGELFQAFDTVQVNRLSPDSSGKYFRIVTLARPGGGP